METSSITFAFSLIFAGAAILASIALYTRQPLIIAYIALGALIGPYGLGHVTDLKLLSDIAHFGIIFLLFLLGLDMQPKALVATMRKASVIALVSSAIFAAIGYAVAFGFGFTHTEAIIIGAAMMFSSTIIGIKLLPTTVLHHRHIGEMMIGLLLIQDVIAIFVLLVLLSGDLGEFDLAILGRTIGALPLFILAAVLIVKHVLLRLLERFDRFHEYIFLLALGWCLGMAEIAHLVGLSAEIGAFIAGIALATSPISQYIAISLKPLRDFFLVMFFFSLGAGFDLSVLPDVALPAAVLAVAMLVAKPLVFRGLLTLEGEEDRLSKEIGVRLGQVSEFGLLIAVLAVQAGAISARAGYLITAATMLTIVVSSYWIMLRYPTPIAVDARLRRD
ncbi:MAG: cation:proton antiporter [Gammaproteobacteria bacterium]|nr:cation:proton antiporter [Gammaproteobacteria bacterium]